MTSYYDNLHLPQLNSCGGYVSNIRGSVFYSPEQDKVDNPGMSEAIKGLTSSTTTSTDYSAPPPMKTGMDGYPYGPVKVSRSGYTSTKALHSSSFLDGGGCDERLLRNRNKSGSCQTRDCGIPSSVLTETQESHGPFERCTDKQNNSSVEYPGSRDSGYTKFMNNFNPISWRQTDATMQFPDEMKPTSMYQTDYLPHELVTGRINCELLPSTDKRNAGGHSNIKELQPCYQPHEIPSQHYCEGSDRFLSTYARDYLKRNNIRSDNTNNMTIVGKANLSSYGNEPSIHIGWDYAPLYRTETMDMLSDVIMKKRNTYTL